LIVDTDAVLSSSVSSQRFQHISRRFAEIVQTGSRIHTVEFPPGDGFNAAPSTVCAQLSQFRRVVIFETPYHGCMIGCYAFNVKQSFLAKRTISRNYNYAANHASHP
jgi:hypothetical protein